MWSKTLVGVKTAPFPVMSVMNVTIVISNSRAKKKTKPENACDE